MTTQNEIENLLALTHGDLLKAMDCIERQLNVIYTRAQVLLSLAGMAVTVTGFSGRLIANTNAYAQFFIVLGLGIIISSVIYIFTKVTSIKWVTASITVSDPKGSLAVLIQQRDIKTNAYMVGGRILCLGLVFYALAVAVMLFNPEPLTVAAR